MYVYDGENDEGDNVLLVVDSGLDSAVLGGYCCPIYIWAVVNTKEDAGFGDVLSGESSDDGRSHVESE